MNGAASLKKILDLIKIMDVQILLDVAGMEEQINLLRYT